jgi:phosphoglycolate phosphatase
MSHAPELVCFDLPCLLVPRPGTAEEALDRALRRLGLEPGTTLHDRAMYCGLRWPGEDARAALGDVLGSDVWADAAAAAFDDAYGAAAVRRGVTVADGAAAALAQLRAMGTRICLTTEFSAATREAILDVLDWTAPVALLLSSGGGDAAVPTALLRADVDPGDAMVVSSTASGVQAGRRAGVVEVVGIASDRAMAGELLVAGASVITTLPWLAAGWAASRLVPA